MFDVELTSVVAIFAGVAALIAYISERAKRRIKVGGQPFQLKKMPRSDASTTEQSSLEDWYFPQQTQGTQGSPDLPDPRSHTRATEMVPEHASAAPAGFQHRVAPSSNYRAIEDVTEHAIGRTLRKKNIAHLRYGPRAQLREAIITMTVLGPCRGLTPHQEREHY